MKKNYNILFLLLILFTSTNALAINSDTRYKKKNISNYFQGIVSLNQNYNDHALNYLKEVRSIKNKHSQFNIEFIRALILNGKLKDAFSFSKNIWNENELFFEADLLLGLEAFIKKDYINAEKYFNRLNKITRHNLYFDNFIGNILIAWAKASQGNKNESFNYLKKIPQRYYNISRIQNIFLKCYFDIDNTRSSFEELIDDKNYNFSRYNFFLINYLLSKNKNKEAKKIIVNSRKKHNSNLLLEQTELFFLDKKFKKIKNFFDCKNPKDSLAEFFYVISNLYSSERDYQTSNFYLKISMFLNSKFVSNKALLAENLYYQNKNRESKKIYQSLKSIGSVYYWYASKNIAAIILDEKGIEYSLASLEKDFNSLKNLNFEHYYELANFYKDNSYFEKSIEYYSLTLENIEKDHFLLPKILERRGVSYERLGDWKSAEKDLIESLKILPDQAHVINYLAYTWIDMGTNLDKGLEMLKKAAKLEENSGYIIDSLGWAYFAKKNYIEAEFFLQQAVKLLPTDPIINDHYADTLWLLNKQIQARHIWNNILLFKGTEKELKENIKKKLIFGIEKNYN